MILFDTLVISDTKLMFPERSAMFKQNTGKVAKGSENRMSPVVNPTSTAHFNTHPTCAWKNETHNFEILAGVL